MSHVAPFTEDEFETAIDAFEKEWYFLVSLCMISKIKPLILKEELSIDISDDTCCDICGSPDATNVNAIIFCDRCDVAVHQECYGVPSLPEGKWLCTRCGLIPQSVVKCILCPHYEGAFKQTEEGDWGHVACANYIEEVGFSNETYLEPIIGVPRINASRLKLRCFLCKLRNGAPIQCASKYCNLSFHVRCAQIANFCMDYTHKKAYCPKHTPSNSRKRKFYGVQVDSEHSNASDNIKSIDHKLFLPKGFKLEHVQFKDSDTRCDVLVPVSTTENHNSAFDTTSSQQVKVSQLPPVLPEILFVRIINGDPWKKNAKNPWKARLEESPKILEQFLNSLAKYWSLKRDLKGAPLIKRLFLEHESSADSLSKKELEEIILKLRKVRFQLEMIRSLAELSKRVLDLKLKDLRQTVKIVSYLKNPSFFEQKATLETLKDIDKQKYFRYPVSTSEVPDYLDIIKNPMDFNTMENELNRGKYLKVAELISSVRNGSIQEKISSLSWGLFKKDFELICTNATTYNAPKTRWYKAAEALKHTGLALIQQKENAMSNYLQNTLSWMRNPISVRLKETIQCIYPYSQKPIEVLIDDEYHSEQKGKENPYSVIDVEF